MTIRQPLTSRQIDELCDRLESAWRSGASPRIEEFLVDAEAGDRELLLRELLFIDHQYRCRSGRPPDEAEYRARFPDHAELIAEVLAAGAGHDAHSQFATGHASGTAHTLDGQPSSSSDAHTHETLAEARLAGDGPATSGATLGDYELLEEVGRGGMGIVFRARQKKVSRIVAVKLLRRDKLKELSPDMRATMIERFRTEAQSAAQLQHDHIVPVYEVGEENGAYYYSMRFVAGESLGDLIKEHPLDNRTAAEMIEPIARALDEAHRCGVLHRDIKPRNVIVETKTKRPLLTDFGLAKLVESNQDMTRTGDVMGSPPYMSPEQATDAASVTRSADIYSLGATLYHILTGRAPFQAANVAETLRQVLFDEPIPLRQLNPAIDADLETIALKCLEKEPGRRFATAGELADELRRYLRNEPIRSRPISTTGRLVRVCRRNPVVSSLGFGIAALLVALPVVLAIGYWRAEESRRVAETNLDLAAEAVDRFTDIATREDGLKAHGLDELRHDFLRTSRDYYDRIAQQQGGGEKLEAERGKAYGRLADIEADLGKHREAANLYRQAVEVFQQLQAAQPAQANYARLAAAFQTNLAASLRDLGEREQAAQTLSAAHDAAHALVESDGEALENLTLLAHIHNEQAVLAGDLGQREAAEHAYSEAVRLWRQVTAKNVSADFIHKQAQAIHNLAMHYQATGRSDEAAQQLAAALAIWEGLNEHYPEISAYMAGLAMCQTSFGLLHLRGGDLAAAEEPLWSALQLRQMLADKHTQVPQYRVELALSHDAMGQLYQAQGKFDEAATAYRDSLLIREALRNQFADMPQLEVSFAASQNSLGALYREHERYAEAAEYFRTALEILQGIAEKENDAIAIQQHVAGAHHNLADALHSAGELDEALAHARLAVELRQALSATHTADDDARAAWADSQGELAGILADQGQADEALAVYARLVPLQRMLAASDGAPLDWQLAAAASGVRYGVVLASREKFDAAQREFTASIQGLDACRANTPAAARLNELLEIALATRAQIYDTLAQFDKAVADWQELSTLCAADQKPFVTLRRAVSLARSGQHAAAVTAMESASTPAMPVDPQLTVQALCVYSRAIEAAEAEKDAADVDRQKNVEKYSAAATALLVRLLADESAAAQLSPATFADEQDLHRLGELPAVKSQLAMWAQAAPAASSP